MEQVIYTQLANVFYAVGQADGQFVKEEKLKVIELVKDHWNTDSQEKPASIIYEQLKKLGDQQTTADEAFDQFKSFFQKNKADFPKEMRLQLYNDAQKIALTYAGRNKSETVMLSRLKHLLEEEKNK